VPIAGWSAAFLVLTACVALALSEPLDGWLLGWARPHDEWPLDQVRWAPAVVVCLARRSVRPALVAAAATAAATAGTLLVKVVTGSPDPHSTGTGDGSFA
jgi:hypothetical protein